MRLAAILTKEVERAAMATATNVRVRQVNTLAAAIVIGFTVNPVHAAIWVLCASLLELIMVFARRAITRGRRQIGRGLYLASAFLFSLMWTAAACDLWMTGNAAYRIVALLVLFTLMVDVASFANRDNRTVLIYGPAPVLAFLILPTFFSGFTGLERLVIGVGVVAVVANLASSGRQSMADSHRLAEARQSAREASRAKSAFLAMMSHELRTPMNGVLGMAHALRRTRLDQEQTERLDMIVSSGDSLLAILNDILDFSKIEAGKLELEAVVFDVQALAEQVCALWRETAEAKAVDLNLTIVKGAPRWLTGDPVRVRQVMQNLVANAVRFTASGEVRLTLDLPPGEGDGVQIAVSDTGVGMSRDQIDRLFRPFIQADSSTARNFGGTGLGLSICHELVQAMGGQITVESAPGAGSTFTVLMPLTAGAQSEMAKGISAPETGLMDLSGLHILVVDDNRVNQAVARAVLEAGGATVDHADDGVAAVEMAARGAYSLILMDLHMPNMDGAEAMAQVRKLPGKAGQAPILACTADARSEEQARLIKLGFAGVHAKPIQPERLLMAVAEFARPAD
jgi:signal transduction histidine kinase/ActR/RegA family two-component response regulator